MGSFNLRRIDSRRALWVSRSKEMPFFSRENAFSQRGGWWVIGQFTLFILILTLPAPDLSEVSFSPFLFHLIGGALITTAILIILTGMKSLGKAMTPFPYPIGNAPLIQEGLYRFVRHPLYSGVVLAGFGVSLWRRNVLAAGLSVALAVLLKAKADQEEVWLIQKFPEYEVYRKKTKQFIPFIY